MDWMLYHRGNANYVIYSAIDIYIVNMWTLFSQCILIFFVYPNTSEICKLENQFRHF